MTSLGTDPVARLAGVSLHYGEVAALEKVDLTIPARRMVAMIGPDGVGKSSLFSLLAGARAIQQGEVEVLGGDMAGQRRAAPGRYRQVPHKLKGWYARGRV